MRKNKKKWMFLGAVLSVLIIISSATAVNINQSKTIENVTIEKEQIEKEEIQIEKKIEEKENRIQKSKCSLCADENNNNDNNHEPKSIISIVIWLLFNTKEVIECVISALAAAGATATCIGSVPACIASGGWACGFTFLACAACLDTLYGAWNECTDVDPPW